MFPLKTANLPQSPSELQHLLTHGLEKWIRISRGISAFQFVGQFPKLEKFEVDLDGASVDPMSRPPVPHLGSPSHVAFLTAAFLLHAQPMRIGSTPVQVQVEAKDMVFEYRPDTQGQYWLAPAEDQDGSGSMEARIRQSQLGELFLSIAAPLAKLYGVQIEDAKVALEQTGQRSIKIAIEATGKKFVMRARLSVLGQIEIDDQLNAHLSSLQARGEGFLGGVVSNLLEPKLEKLNGMTFPLAGLGLGSLGLHDLQLEVGEDVVLRAAFGGTSANLS